MGSGTKALIIIVVAAVVGAGVFLPGEYSAYKERAQQGDPVAGIANAAPSAISPSGELYETFRLGTNSTDVQRQNLESKIKGQIVQWTLPVYEVRRTSTGYKIQTSSESKMFGLATPFIGTFASVSARSPEEASYIEGLMTGHKVTIKGRIAGLSAMRSIEIEPAIVVLTESVNASTAPAAPSKTQPTHPTGQSPSLAMPGTAGSSTATLEVLLKDFALPAEATYSANDWQFLEKIPSVKWARIADGRAIGLGTLDGLGEVSVNFEGARTMVLEGHVFVSEEVGKVIERDEFDSALARQFASATSVRRLRSSCPDEVGVSGTSVYEVAMKNKKPIFILLERDSGGSSPNSGSSTFYFSLQNEPRWKCTA